MHSIYSLSVIETLLLCNKLFQCLILVFRCLQSFFSAARAFTKTKLCIKKVNSLIFMLKCSIQHFIVRISFSTFKSKLMLYFFYLYYPTSFFEKFCLIKPITFIRNTGLLLLHTITSKCYK